MQQVIKESEQYSLDFPLNLRNQTFTIQDVRFILQQRMPCGMFTIISGALYSPTGSGTYIKHDSHTFEILTEQGTCLGLMADLYPTRETSRRLIFPQAPAS